jgi:hypothetical protein
MITRVPESANARGVTPTLSFPFEIGYCRTTGRTVSDVPMQTDRVPGAAAPSAH